MVIYQQMKEERHDQTYCMLLPFNFHSFLFKIQIIKVKGFISNLF